MDPLVREEPENELVIRPPSEIVIGAGQPLSTYVPANRLTLGAASAVGVPASRTTADPSAASATHPASVHRVIDRAMFHLVFVGS